MKLVKASSMHGIIYQVGHQKLKETICTSNNTQMIGHLVAEKEVVNISEPKKVIVCREILKWYPICSSIFSNK